MCSSHRPEAGADSADIFDDLATYLVADAFLEALKDDACPLCQGRGVMMGGDDYRECPRCHGAREA